MKSKLKINPNKQGLLSGGPSLILRPLWAMSLGSIAAALLWEQLNFMSGKEGEKKPVRISYSGLEKQLPFFSRRWLIETVKRLEKLGAMKVIKTTRVNQFDVLDFEVLHEPTDQNLAHMVVYPDLAVKVGLTEAIVIQQIHIRQWDKDGSWWFRRPLHQWQTETFMFLSLATVQRVFVRLEKDGLLLTKPYISESGKMKSYRLSYLRLAEVMDSDAPIVVDPNNNGWVNPLYPV